ncbi:hypothetical protein Plo01_02940 [Planobispora longispora]|uniref:Uncharacterized protein n=1 Tax=Planobispora longispora TaxID=28887 RepID=A0A8J3W324_9ACTN|nr:hypothetical protein GCM10020093_002680 [Planobispora longispora]GIH73865.1 hypothetical protein Plo01_02940 [Planobispora longispora]
MLRPAGPWTPAAHALLHHLERVGFTGSPRVVGTARLNAQLHDDDVAEAVQARITPESADAEPLWAVAWRARSAAWMIRHRPLLERAVTT